MPSLNKTNRSVVLLHGWPGSPNDFRRVLPLLANSIHVFALDLLGFGDGFSGSLLLEEATAEAHADRVIEFIHALGLEKPVIAGYDIGSRIAQAVARQAPNEIAGIVITPAYPGIGARALEPASQAQYWYQHFHRLDVSADILDGNESALRAYLNHFWRNWSRDDTLATGPAFEALVTQYARAGAFRASIAWYRANKGYPAADVILVPTIMLWPEQDDLFPSQWADRLNEFFEDARLVSIPKIGHFVPLEAPDVFARAITDLLETS